MLKRQAEFKTFLPRGEVASGVSWCPLFIKPV